MEYKDLITAIGIILTFIIGVFNLLITIKNSKKTQFINIVTSSRIKWIGELRDLTSSLVSHTLLGMEPDSWTPGKERAEFNKKLMEMNQKIHLLLNFNDSRDKEIIGLVDKLVNDMVSLSVNLYVKSDLANSKSPNLLTTGYISTNIIELCSKTIPNTTKELVERVQEYLKEEWERVKKESKNGDLADILEKRSLLRLSEMKHFSELKSWIVLDKFYNIKLITKLKILLLILLLGILILLIVA